MLRRNLLKLGLSSLLAPLGLFYRPPAESWWKGIRPGKAFEFDPSPIEWDSLTDSQVSALLKSIEEYDKGLRRYLALKGIG